MVKDSIFEVFRDEKGDYGFRLKNTAGEVIAESSGYPTKREALKKVNSVKKNAETARIAGTEITELSERIPVDEIDIIEYQSDMEEETPEIFWDYTLIVALVALFIAIISLVIMAAL